MLKRFSPLRACLALALAAVVLGASARSAHAADNWRIEPSRTTIRFAVPSSVWGTTTGQFRSFDGRLSIDFDRPSRSRVNFNVLADSVTTGSSGVDAYIKSEVLFDVARFPAMRFVSQKVEKLGDRTASVEGDLTLHGETRPLRLIVEVERGKDGRALQLTARGTVKRSDFGMDAGVPIVSDDVTFTVAAEAVAP